MTSRDVALTARCSSPTAHAPALPSSTCSLPSKHWIHGFASACTWVSVDNFLPCSSLNPRSSLLLSYPSNISASATTTLCSTDPSSALDPLVLMCRRTHTCTVQYTAQLQVATLVLNVLKQFQHFARLYVPQPASARSALRVDRFSDCSAKSAVGVRKRKRCVCTERRGRCESTTRLTTSDDQTARGEEEAHRTEPNRTECVGESEARSGQA